MKKISEEVRKESVPYFVEIRTYRYRGHSMSDPQKYRTKEELQEYQKTDPVERMKKYILDEKILKEKKIEEIEQNVEDTVLDAIDFAEESSFPEPDELYEDMYAGTPHFHDKK